MRVSVQTLRDRLACSDQVEAFEVFLAGRSYVLATPRNIRLAAKAGLDVEWASERGLIPPLNGMIERASGTKWWFLKGKLHRTDGPAVERDDGTKQWWVKGKLHRVDGPAVERSDGLKQWWVKGKLHRVDGPAVEGSDGLKQWWVKGKLHRVDGPAIEGSNGLKEWWLNGEFLRRETK